ncbi:MAG: Hsp70 family protein, partial [Bifidobacteriaceae bacterium]|nr:Hsp70 family protein [Bifidobacteriaceae bacterium]
MPAIGIDLGTTYCCVLHRTAAGGEELIRSAAGGELTPSVVYFDPDGSVAVGQEARRAARIDPDNAVFGIKRHMGEDFPLEFHGLRYTPEAISGIILKRLALDAAAHFAVGPERLRAVITVPAYFGVAEKEATHAAARIAKLDCLELLAEPVAAAYAYGADPAAEDCSLVFDLGGGTFDVAVVGMVDGQP